MVETNFSSYSQQSSIAAVDFTKSSFYCVFCKVAIILLAPCMRVCRRTVTWGGCHKSDTCVFTAGS